MAKRTFQEIYDFCKRDATYQVYYSVPDGISEENIPKYQYLFGDISKGQSRVGTYYYRQSYQQLVRFLTITPQTYSFLYNFLEGKIMELRSFEGSIINSYIEQQGVTISFLHPLTKEVIRLNPRSHLTYDENGICQEVLKYLHRGDC